MRRSLSHLVQVACLLLPATLLQAQHVGAPTHSGGTASPARTFAPPAWTSFPGASRSPTFRPALPSHRPGGISLHPPNSFGYRRSYPLVYAGYPWLFPLGYGFSGDEESGDQGVYQPPPQAAEPPPVEQAEIAPSPFRPEYQAAPEPAPLRDQPATTLIFNDGRPPAQTHNYALTATTLYALDGDTRKEIPLSLINVPATVEANRDAGIDFALPVTH